MKSYGVKKLAEISGVSVRTLHYYDKSGLLKPGIRTESRYRLYGEKELLRLQQILFYKELGFSLRNIRDILDDPDFGVVKALQEHKCALMKRQEKISELVETLDKTILKLNGEIMLNDKDLYKGLSQEKATFYRKEAISKYGSEEVERSETNLKRMTAEELEGLKEYQKKIARKLYDLKDYRPESQEVQEWIRNHYILTRKFWGTDGERDNQKEAYKGLGELYQQDDRFILSMIEKNDAAFGKFLSAAMVFFAENLN